jgi:hypothetical protein
VRPAERLEGLFEELAELTGQRNAIDARIVEIVAEVDRDELWGATGARSVAALVAWKTGTSSTNANTIATVAGRLHEFPRCAAGLRAGRLSLDQLGVIAARAGQGSDEHYAELARSATVNQLRTAVKLEPRPEPESESDPRPEPQASITKTTDEQVTCWRIRLPHLEAATFCPNRPPVPRGSSAARAAHHRGDASGRQGAGRGVASGSAAVGGRPPLPDL